jgi:hypothetical protein
VTAGLFKIPGYPDGATDVVPGMAFFRNTGPSGTTCGGCKHLNLGRGKKKACAKFAEMTGERGPPLDRFTASCKYYEAATP